MHSHPVRDVFQQTALLCGSDATASGELALFAFRFRLLILKPF
jgi:hypothetical protein